MKSGHIQRQSEGGNVSQSRSVGKERSGVKFKIEVRKSWSRGKVRSRNKALPRERSTSEVTRHEI